MQSSNVRKKQCKKNKKDEYLADSDSSSSDSDSEYTTESSDSSESDDEPVKKKSTKKQVKQPKFVSDSDESDEEEKSPVPARQRPPQRKAALEERKKTQQVFEHEARDRDPLPDEANPSDYAQFQNYMDGNILPGILKGIYWTINGELFDKVVKTAKKKKHGWVYLVRLFTKPLDHYIYKVGSSRKIDLTYRLSGLQSEYKANYLTTLLAAVHLPDCEDLETDLHSKLQQVSLDLCCDGVNKKESYEIGSVAYEVIVATMAAHVGREKPHYFDVGYEWKGETETYNDVNIDDKQYTTSLEEIITEQKIAKPNHHL